MVNFIELLPPECTLAILSFLPPADLCQAVRVSSSWREVVEPLLYKHVAISSLDEMMRLLASVERRPQLSEYVRQFLVWEIDPSPAYEDVTSRVVRQFADLRGLFLWRWPFNLHFLSGHSHLKWITLHQRKARPMNQVRPLWDLPNVECIHATLEEPEAPVDQWPIARKLVTLELYTCTLSERSLEILLQASPGLKSLHFANRYNIGSQFSGFFKFDSSWTLN